jgi:hypothetical protein
LNFAISRDKNIRFGGDSGSYNLNVIFVLDRQGQQSAGLR